MTRYHGRRVAKTTLIGMLQLEEMEAIRERTGVSVQYLIREGLDMVLKKHARKVQSAKRNGEEVRQASEESLVE